MKFIADPRYQLVMKYLTAIMAVAYIVLGTAVLLSMGKLEQMPAAQKVPLGIMLIGYGIFRAWRFAVKYLLTKGENNDEQ
ncbi:hypothetical protein [Cesiribacter sp. SM1]|uniref:hypothetical protein n=1 Tax=Cesiribacter sp. SM1 TaxID=2861196 RepID=UPI001CD37F7D|nr:hypothetical protein [Cesiribacter sp. SM1]